MPPALIARAGMIGALLGGAACGSSNVDGPIDFEVGGGFGGGGDGTPSLHIELDGSATRTKATTTKTATLDAATMRDLRTKIERAQIPTLAESYERCCDMFSYRVSVLLDGTAYTVTGTKATSHDQPARLQLVFDTLDQIATSSVWQ